jgi:hypothetical protein
MLDRKYLSEQSDSPFLALGVHKRLVIPITRSDSGVYKREPRVVHRLGTWLKEIVSIFLHDWIALDCARDAALSRPAALRDVAREREGTFA